MLTIIMIILVQERRWAYIRAGCAQDYHGIAVHPRHLSWWERNVLNIHRCARQRCLALHSVMYADLFVAVASCVMRSLTCFTHFGPSGLHAIGKYAMQA